MVIQERHENPSQFLNCLTKTLLEYINVDPQSLDGKQLLMTYFFSQSFPDIKAKLKSLERGPLDPQAEALAVTFKIYHERDESKIPQNKSI